MKARQQARRRYRRYESASFAGRLETIARPGLDLVSHLPTPQLNSRWVALGLLIVTLGLIAWLSADDTFYVSRMRVIGATRTAPLDIAEKSGLVGLHVFWTNGDEAEKTLLRQVPALKSAMVVCEFPANCTITVVERTPVIAWRYGEAVTWIDAESATFPEVKTKSPLALVTIEAVQGPALIPGRPADSKVVTAALSVARLLPEVKSYRYSGAHGLEFTDERGVAVYLGLGADMTDRVMVWQALRADLGTREVLPTYVDIRQPLSPYYGPPAQVAETP